MVCAVYMYLLLLFCVIILKFVFVFQIKREPVTIYLVVELKRQRIDEIMLCGLCCPSVPVVVVLSMLVPVLGFYCVKLVPILDSSHHVL